MNIADIDFKQLIDDIKPDWNNKEVIFTIFRFRESNTKDCPFPDMFDFKKLTILIPDSILREEIKYMLLDLGMIIVD